MANDAQAIMETVKVRLISLAENRPFRFINTRKGDALHYLKTMTSYEGLNEQEITHLESTLKINFPTVFKQYLLNFGKSKGHLFRGSDFNPQEFSEYKIWLEEILAENNISSFLTDETIVFISHQGCSFNFFIAEDMFDTPIYSYSEGDDKPNRTSESFATFLDAHLEAVGKINQQLIGGGGHFLQVLNSGRTMITSPARNSGIRPLDMDDQFKGGVFTKVGTWLSQRKRKKDE
jgi:hypothetical protein